MGGALEKAAKKILLRSCGCLSDRDRHQQHHQALHVLDTFSPASSPPQCLTTKASPCKKISSRTEYHQANKNLCTICLDPLSHSPGSSPGRAVFTAQCSHIFHLACISSNVQHGSTSCPVCRARWTQLPRRSLHHPEPDPVLQILEDSIATSRAHRRSLLLDDPLPRLSFSLLPAAPTSPGTCLNVKLTQRPPIDLVLTAGPNGPHIGPTKQMMALVVFSLRPVDRLAVVAGPASRAFPLRCMSPHGKRTALRFIDGLFCSGPPAGPAEALERGVEILRDRAHKNAHSCVFHLTDGYDGFDGEVPFAVHRFDVGLGFGVSGGFVVHGFEDFLAGALGGGVRSVRLRIGEDDGGFFGIGELRGGEERSFPVAELAAVRVEYSYVECGDDEGCVVRGEASVRFGGGGGGGFRRSSGAWSCNWDYHDALMARRWAKHLDNR